MAAIRINLEEMVRHLEPFDRAGALPPAELRARVHLENVAVDKALKGAPAIRVFGRRKDVFLRGHRARTPNDIAMIEFTIILFEPIAIVADIRDEERRHGPSTGIAVHCQSSVGLRA
jgi:hypothetical protein